MRREGDLRVERGGSACGEGDSTRNPTSKEEGSTCREGAMRVKRGGGRPGAVRAERGRSAQSGEAGTARAQTEAAHSESRGGDV